MSDLVRRELAHHPCRGVLPIPPATVLLLGLPLVAAGLLALLVGLGFLRAGGLPRAAVLLAGAILLAAGALTIAGWAAGVRRRRRREDRARRHAGEPWRIDHEWDPTGARDEAPAGAVGPAIAAAGLALLLLPFQPMAFLGERPLTIRFAVVFLDAVWLGLVATALGRAVRHARHGRTRLEFDRFPFFVGETLSARFEVPARFEGARAVTFTLRAIEEALVTRGAGRSRARRVVCIERHAASRTLEIGAPGTEVPVDFPLPPDAPPTRLAEAPATYWELVATAGARDLEPEPEAVFLVPVYAPDP